MTRYWMKQIMRGKYVSVCRREENKVRIAGHKKTQERTGEVVQTGSLTGNDEIIAGSLPWQCSRFIGLFYNRILTVYQRIIDESTNLVCKICSQESIWNNLDIQQYSRYRVADLLQRFKSEKRPLKNAIMRQNSGNISMHTRWMKISLCVASVQNSISNIIHIQTYSRYMVVDLLQRFQVERAHLLSPTLSGMR